MEIVEGIAAAAALVEEADLERTADLTVKRRDPDAPIRVALNNGRGIVAASRAPTSRSSEPPTRASAQLDWRAKPRNIQRTVAITISPITQKKASGTNMAIQITHDSLS